MSDRVVLGYIHNNSVDEAFMQSVLGLLVADRNKGLIAGWQSVRGLYVAKNRNKVCRDFLERGKGDWLLFVDTDIIFNSEDVYALHEFNKPIAGGLYFTHMNPQDVEQVAPVWLYGQGPYFASTEVPQEPVQVAGLGMGFTIIHREVLEKFAANYAKPFEFFGHDVWGEEDLGEDLSFCLRAQALGYELWGHPGIRVRHAKRTVI